MVSEGSEYGADAPTAVVTGTRDDEDPSESSQPAFVPPERVERYILGRMLGAGGLGIVFEAWDPKLERHVAVKLVRSRRRKTELRGAERFLREAQALARLSHPNVVGVYGVGTCEDGKTVYVVMEHVGGKTLRSWEEDTVPTPETLLEVFRAAGRGLAAAHAAGIVHRDFKPDNVMVDEDGRVRVLDFGLALMGEDGTGNSSVLESLSGAAPALAESSMDGRLTKVGVVMGTPTYMSPEQHLGRAVSAASDQYSFCVAFLRMLWGGQSLFAGRAPREVAIAKARGRVEPRPEGSAAPRWLEAVLLRGLQPEPEDRWPSMEALLGALEGKRSRARWGIGAAVLGLVGVGVAFGLTPTEHDCAQGSDRLETSWDSEARERATDSVLASLGSRGTGVLDRLEHRLDADVEAWGTAYRSTCEAHAAAQIDDATFDQRMSCLRMRAGQRERLIMGVAADSDQAEHVPEALLQLDAVSTCVDDAALAEAAVLRPRPDDPARRAVAEAAREQLAWVSELSRAGKFDAADKVFAEVTPRIMGLGFKPLVAELRHAQGRVAYERGDRDRAEALYEDALAAAEACGHDVVAASVASDLVFLYSTAFRRFEDAERMLAYAGALVERAGSPATLKRRLALSAMSFYSRQQRYAEALDMMAEAMPDRAPETVGERYQYSISLNNLALLHMRTGDDRRAETLLIEALTLREEALGAGHPKLGNVHLNVAKAMIKNGNYADAESHLTESIALLSAFGDDHLSMARPLIARGVVRKKQGRFDEARVDYERALGLARRADRVQMQAMVLANLGNLEKRSGNVELALERHVEALAMREAELGPDHLDVAASYGDIASLYRRMERFDEAWKQIDRELKIKRKALKDDHPKLVSTYQRRANLALDQEDYTRARSELDSAFRILEHHGLEDTAAASSFLSLGRMEFEQDAFGPAIRAYREGLRRYEAGTRSPGMLGGARLGLAKALWASGDDAAARDAISRARVELRQAGAGVAEELEELEAVAASWSGPMPKKRPRP